MVVRRPAACYGCGVTDDRHDQSAPDIKPDPAPVEEAMNMAWIRITMATLVCPCGHEQPTGNMPGDHERQPEQTCSRCGAVWFTPCAADCEPAASPLPKGGPAPLPDRFVPGSMASILDTLDAEERLRAAGRLPIPDDTTHPSMNVVTPEGVDDALAEPVDESEVQP